MRSPFLIAIFGLASAAMIAAPVGSSPVLGLVSSRASFALSRVETRPEAGPLPVVDGDEITAGLAPVLFRLSGPNRVVLGGSSHAQIRPIRDSGRYFYLSKGSIQFDAMKEPIAICAVGKLYVPTVPASGEVVILDNKRVEVHMTSGVMERNGQDACNAKGAPAFLLQGAVGATAGVAGAVGAAGAGAAGAAGAGAAGAAAAGAAGAGVAGAGVAGAAVAGISTATAVSTGAAVAAGVATVTQVTGIAATPPAPPQASVSIPTP